MRFTRSMVVVAALLAAAGCKKAGDEGPPPKPPPAPVTAVPAESADVPVYLDEIGRTASRENVTIQPQVSGRIMERHFTDGSDVKAGDPLFTIDPRPYKAQLESAEATLAQSKAELELTRQDFGRSEKLLKEQALSQQDYDTTKSAVAVAEARVKQNEAAIETVKLNLEYCSIKSPITGRAGRSLVDVGNIIEANQAPLLVIQSLDPIYADFTIAEKHLSSVQRKLANGRLKVEVQIPGDGGAPLEGELTFVDNAVHQLTGTVKLRATVANAEHRLWPGRFVKVRLVLDTIQGAVLVPATAIQLSAMGPYVYVVSKDSKAEMRPVKVGQRQGDRVVIESGVEAGEQVITSSSMMVSPASDVRVLPPAPSQDPKP